VKKPWFRSKTMWAGIVLIVYGCAEILVDLPLDPNSIIPILLGVLGIGLRQAMP